MEGKPQTSTRRVLLLVIIVFAALFVLALLMYGVDIARQTGMVAESFITLPLPM